MGEHAGCRWGLRITPAPRGKAMGSHQQRPRMRPTSIPAGKAAPGEVEGTAGEEPGARRAQRNLSPSPKLPALSPPEHRLGGYLMLVAPAGLWGTSHERCRHICRSTSGCCSAGPGFTLALPPPAAVFRSHPEGRSLAGLRRPVAVAWAPALFAPSTWFLSLSALPGSARAAVIAAPRSSPCSPRPGASSPLEEPHEAAAGRRLSGHPPSLLALCRALVRGSGREKQVRAPKLKAWPPEGEEAASSS